MTTPQKHSPVIVASLVLAPVLSLASSLVAPTFKTDEGAQLAVIAAHPDRWYWFTILLLAGGLLLVPALLGIAVVVRERSPRLGEIGGWLAILGALIAIGDVMSQLTLWQMVTPGADRAQMTALLARSDDAVGVSTVYTVGGLAVLIGTVLLTIGLIRSRVVPVWSAIALTGAVVVNLVGFTVASDAIVGVSWVILLAAMLPVARVLSPRRERLTASVAPSS